MKPLFKYHCKIQIAEDEQMDTWGVYAITKDAKILDGIYDPTSKSLRVIFDSVAEGFEDYPVRKKDGKYEYQNRRIEKYYKGVIHEEDLQTFLDTYVENNFEFKEKGLIITDEQE